MQRMVKYFNLTRGDEFMVEDQIWETVATDLPGDGTVQVWARNVEGNYETFYRRVEELAVCPVYGQGN